MTNPYLSLSSQVHSGLDVSVAPLPVPGALDSSVSSFLYYEVVLAVLLELLLEWIARVFRPGGDVAESAPIGRDQFYRLAAAGSGYCLTQFEDWHWALQVASVDGDVCHVVSLLNEKTDSCLFHEANC